MGERGHSQIHVSGGSEVMRSVRVNAISKSLRKEREERYQTIKVLQIDLRQLKQRLELDAEMQRSAQIAAGQKAARDGTLTRMRMVEEAWTQMGSRAFRLI